MPMDSDDNQPHISTLKWIDTEAPAKSQIVRVQARDGFGLYVLPFPVAFRNDNWLNAETEEELDCFVAGWLPWE